MECRIFGSRARKSPWEYKGRIFRPARPDSDLDVVVVLDSLAYLMAVLHSYSKDESPLDWSEKILTIFDGEEGLAWFNYQVTLEARRRYEVPDTVPVDVSLYVPPLMVPDTWSLRLTPVSLMPSDYPWMPIVPGLERNPWDAGYQERRLMTGLD